MPAAVALSGVAIRTELPGGDDGCGDDGGLGGFRHRAKSPQAAASSQLPPPFRRAPIDWGRINAALEGKPYAGGGPAPPPVPGPPAPAPPLAAPQLAAPKRPKCCDKASGPDSPAVAAAGTAPTGAAATKKNRSRKVKKKPADWAGCVQVQPPQPQATGRPSPNDDTAAPADGVLSAGVTSGSLAWSSKLASTKGVWWLLLAVFCLGYAVGCGLAQSRGATHLPPAQQCPPQAATRCPEPSATTLAPNRKLLLVEQHSRAKAEKALAYCEKKKGHLLEQVHYMATSMTSTGTDA